MAAPWVDQWDEAQRAWLELGQRMGWCSAPVCATHDGLPSTREDVLRWDEGGDPCEHAVRLWHYGEEAWLPGGYEDPGTNREGR